MTISSVKVRFTFATDVASHDPKTTVLLIVRIQLEDDDECFAFPDHLQAKDLHESLLGLSIAKSARKVLTTRYETAKFWITLPPDVAKLYVDEQGNPTFKGELLRPAPPYESRRPIIEKSALSSPTNLVIDRKPLTTIMKDAVLEKFGSKPMNATTWLETFESECVRLKVLDDEYQQAISLFLEKSGLDWFQYEQRRLRTAPWHQWHDSFLDAFAPRGWSTAREAIQYRYYNGSLSEYALKKLNLLTSFNPKMDQDTIIALIVVNLPFAIQDKIDRSEIPSVSKLLSKINAFDRVPRGSIPQDDNSRNQYRTRNYSDPQKPVRGPCTYCEKKGHSGRAHFESECKTKLYDINKSNSYQQSNVKSQYDGSRSTFFNQNNVKSQSFSKTPEKKAMNTAELQDLLSEITTESKNA